MYKLIYVAAFLSIFVSCTKEVLPENCIDDVCVDGEWEWVDSYGSIAGLTITPETEDENRELIITEMNYQEIVNGEVIVDLAYEFVKSGELEGFTTDSLILKLADGNWLSVHMENENLILKEPCFDCWEHTYKSK